MNENTQELWESLLENLEKLHTSTSTLEAENSMYLRSGVTLLKENESLKSEVEILETEITKLKKELEEVKSQENLSQILAEMYRMSKNKLEVELENLKKNGSLNLNGFSNEDLKRLRRYIHPDFTQKPTEDLFIKVGKLIK